MAELISAMFAVCGANQTRVEKHLIIKKKPTGEWIPVNDVLKY